MKKELETSYQKLRKLNKDIDIVNNEIQDIFQKQRDLYEERRIELVGIIKLEEYLSKLHWKYEDMTENNIYLLCEEDCEYQIIKTLAALIGDIDVDFYFIEPFNRKNEICLYSNDGELRLKFSQIEEREENCMLNTLWGFQKEYKLNIDFTLLNETIVKNAKRIELFEELKELFDLP